jgi:hypothetical protein
LSVLKDIQQEYALDSTRRCYMGEFLQLLELVTGQRRGHFEVTTNVREATEHLRVLLV